MESSFGKAILSNQRTLLPMIYIGYEERGAPKTLLRLILEDRDAEPGKPLRRGMCGT